MKNYCYHIAGKVQGIGFRPTVKRLADRLQLHGAVRNCGNGATILLQGEPTAVAEFWQQLQSSFSTTGSSVTKPSTIELPDTTVTELPPPQNFYSDFQIEDSDDVGLSQCVLPADVAPCVDCLAELFDPSNRRYRYPFISCARCGPRYSIIERMPFDREHTAMATFAQCSLCRREYEDSGDRRFHAQTNACPQCGPRVYLTDDVGTCVDEGDAALQKAIALLRGGAVLALQGVGGFQLLARADDDAAIQRIRTFKQRPSKPLAAMFADIEQLQQFAQLQFDEIRWLSSPQAPIVLVRTRGDSVLSGLVAPANPYLGAMLPSSPLHHLLCREVGVPLLVTSGNRGAEPLCYRSDEAFEKLNNIAVGFLCNNRAIVRPVDDSVLRCVGGRTVMLRQARGFTDAYFRLPEAIEPTVAAGAHWKNAPALQVGERVFISPYIGDLDTLTSRGRFRARIEQLCSDRQITASAAVVDKHPDYFSSRYCTENFSTKKIRAVQHHRAHIGTLLAERGMPDSALAIVWDGTGLGDDGRSAWGGEFFLLDGGRCQHIAQWLPLMLPGGDSGAREPRRCAASWLYSLYGVTAIEQPEWKQFGFSAEQEQLLLQQLAKNLHCVAASGVGRLFDAVAALLGLCNVAEFEGQAALQVEFAALRGQSQTAYPWRFERVEKLLCIDQRPLLAALLADLRAGVAVEEICRRFHHTLVEVSFAIAAEFGQTCVWLAGGCFQNALLLELLLNECAARAFELAWPQQLPINDGGLAAGQLAAVAYNLFENNFVENNVVEKSAFEINVAANEFVEN